MKGLLTISFLFISAFCTAQYQLDVNASVGFGVNKSLELNGEKYKENTTMGTNISINNSFRVFRTWRLDAAVGLLSQRFRGQHRRSKYTGLSHRIFLDLLIGHKTSEKISIYGGLGGTTHRDFEMLDIKRFDNLRANLLAKAMYQHSDRLAFTASGRYLINDIGDSYLINFPRYQLFVGAQYRLLGKTHENATKKDK